MNKKASLKHSLILVGIILAIVILIICITLLTMMPGKKTTQINLSQKPAGITIDKSEMLKMKQAIAQTIPEFREESQLAYQLTYEDSVNCSSYSPNLRNTCYMSVARKLKDPSYCMEIRDSQIRKLCEVSAG
ncbi:hypothetical protein DRJ17_01935 [Candidatus Woesearchaeota archaeon]|nr:MAG: hypothetical protein DRJ17_01935 [Candidatus Woesearchaeota archaeon]